MKDIIDHIETKLLKFQSCPADTEEFRRLKVYLDQDFLPLLKEVLSWAKINLGSTSFDGEYCGGFKDIEPFGFRFFHNALREGNGQIKFLDFEYFGWD